MPEKVKPLWESLSSAEKQSIIAASTKYKLETPYQIKNFWDTRNLAKTKTVGLQRINENESAASALPAMRGYSNDYISNVADELGKRFKIKK